MTNISTLGQALDQIQRLKKTQTSLATLQLQLNTGKKTQQFKGLGTDVIISERARANFKELDAYKNNIDIADRRIKLMMNALAEIKQQGANLANALQMQTQEGEFEMASVGDLASKVMQFVNNLINEKDGDRYLFGGSETLTEPLGGNGTLNTFINGQLDAWVNSNLSTDDLIANYKSKDVLNDTIVGYSSGLSSNTAKSVTIRVQAHTELDFTVLANGQGMRDITVAAAMLAGIAEKLDSVALKPGDDPLTTTTAPGADKAEKAENFYKMFNDIAAMLNKSLKAIEKEEFKLSMQQAQINQIKERHELEQNILQETINDVENVDLNDVAVKLNALQFQLEASYRVTASVQGLSLVNFIGR